MTSTVPITMHDSPNVPEGDSGPPQHLSFGSDPFRSPRPGHPNVFSRLQALFPASPSLSSPLPPRTPSLGTDASNKHAHAIPPPAKSLKVRIITWNMHESLPKGDLRELLGEVPPYTPYIPLDDPAAFPYLPAEAEHPYHLVVVAGQECPSLSRLPMALGAGFKLKEKEKDKEKDKDKDKEKDREKDADREEKEAFKDNLKDLQHRLLKHEQDEHAHTASTSGWTSVLEDWFCHGVHPHTLAVARAPLKDVGRAFSSGDVKRRHTTSMPTKVSATAMARAGSPAATPMPGEPVRSSKGPYEMLVKERMMGLYLAVFVHRDAKRLVTGTSHAAVTAGLIGGRVGNKGGVGVSLNIAGSTILFLNAHLAAHEGKILHRLANLSKIKNELAVDAFLKYDDPRMVAEDLTDKFDYTFLCGDLNFRLDISRLHADWLISKQKYAEALAFDQLYNLMRNGQAFVGFREAPINFPPTFKYDVLRTLKGKRKGSTRETPAAPFEEASAPPADVALAEAPQPESKPSSDGEEEHDNGEAMSIMSSGTSYSKKTVDDHEPDESDDEDDEDFDVSPLKDAEARAQELSRRRSGATRIVKRISSTAAHKAKLKWNELISPAASPQSATKWPRAPGKRQSAGQAMLGPDSYPASMPSTPVVGGRDYPNVPTSQSAADHEALLHSPLFRKRASSTKSGTRRLKAALEEDKGVYDSSSKQRVPSWCDRILWKSSVKPRLDDEDEDPAQHRTQFGQLFVNAWRTIASRSRRGSTTSSRSTELSPSPSIHTYDSGLPPISPSDSVALARSISGTPNLSSPSQGARRNRRPKSVEISSTSSPDSLFRSQSSTYLDQSLTFTPHLPPISFTPPRPNNTPSVPVRSSTSPELTSPTPFPFAPMTASPRQSSDTPPPVPPKDPVHTMSTPYRWRFLPFMGRDTTSGSQSGTPAPSEFGHGRDAPGAPAHKPKRGEVVCLSYQTLDDRGMRRLEGRSDHRPVIGSYAIYI